MPKLPSISELAAMDDAALSEILGYNQQISSAREDFAKLSTLKGEARAEAEDRIQNMLSPKIYASDLGYLYDDLKRKSKKGQSADEALADTEVDLL